MSRNREVYVDLRVIVSTPKGKASLQASIILPVKIEHVFSEVLDEACDRCKEQIIIKAKEKLNE